MIGEIAAPEVVMATRENESPLNVWTKSDPRLIIDLISRNPENFKYPIFQVEREKERRAERKRERETSKSIYGSSVHCTG